jgi:glycosyltransferase involved in cell wall biosynthesis
MSFGAVPFVTPVPSVREIVRQGSNGMYLNGSDAHRDARIIQAAIADKNLIEDLGRRAFRSAQRNRWERQAGRLERIISR